MFKKARQSGFVILYAVLLTSVVLGIGIILISIIAKQIQLASIERSSQTAYYAADAARQCALLWDQNDETHNAFGNYGEGLSGSPILGDAGNAAVACFLPSVTTSGPLSSNVPPCALDADACYKIIIDNLSVEPGVKNCATVYVEKGGASTTITASGYNQVSCSDTSLLTPNPRRVQRTITTRKE